MVKRLNSKAHTKKKIVIIIGSILLLFICVFAFFPKEKTPPPPIQSSKLSHESAIIKSPNTTVFTLQSYNSAFYKTKTTGLDAAYEFIKTNPSNIFREDADAQTTLQLVKSIKDQESPSLNRNTIASTNEHYFFSQSINTIPVYGSNIGIHLRNGNEIYSVDGNVIKNQALAKEKLSPDQAQYAAMDKARTESNPRFALSIVKTQKYIFNRKILKLGNDDTNYVSLAVTIKNNNADMKNVFQTEYIVDLVSGTILNENSQIRHAAPVNITDTSNAATVNAVDTPGCTTTMTKKDCLTTLITNLDDYLSQKRQWNGFDNKGGTLKLNLKPPCQDAFAVIESYELNICEDMITADIIHHELGHILGFYTSGIAGQANSSLDEGFADVWGTVLSKLWITYLDDTKSKVIRDFGLPSNTQNPDTIFSSNYDCQEVHNHGVVLPHTLFLIIEGGTQSGCTVTGIGRDKGYDIYWTAITKYIQSKTPNYLDIYTGFKNACNDLFKEGSPECIAVETASKSTEIDQQPAGAAESPKCTGGTEQPVVCPAPASVSPSGSGTVPSPACLGSCPTLPVSPSAVQTPSTAITQPASGSIVPTAPVTTQPSIAPLPDLNNLNPGGNAAGGGQKGLFFLLLGFFLFLIKLLFGG